MVKLMLVWVLAIFFLISAVVVLFKSKWNMGSLALWAFSFGLIIYGIFMPQIDGFTQSGLGLFLKIGLWFCILGWLGFILFLALAGYRGAAKGDEAVLLVLGAGLHKTEVSDILQRRLQMALCAYKKNPKVVLVVCGGQGRGEDISEALAMQRWLLAHSVPENAIYMEDESTSTQSNLLYARAILEEQGLFDKRPVAVVTNHFHCFRGRYYARQAGFCTVRSIAAGMNRPTFLQNYLREALALFQLLVLHMLAVMKKYRKKEC